MNFLTQLMENKILISESGIKTAQDIKILKDAGFNGALIGESMMRSKNKQQFLLSLKGEENSRVQAYSLKLKV